MAEKDARMDGFATHAAAVTRNYILNPRIGIIISAPLW